MVNPSGKYWRLKYRHGGKEKAIALGVYPEVSLKEARAKLVDARRLIAEGVDPGFARKQEKAASQFASESSLEAIAQEWHQRQLAAWSPGHTSRVIGSLEMDAFPVPLIEPLRVFTRVYNGSMRCGAGGPPQSSGF